MGTQLSLEQSARRARLLHGLAASCQTQDRVKAPGKPWGESSEDRGRDDEACWQHPVVVPFPGCLMLLLTPLSHRWSLKPEAEKKPPDSKTPRARPGIARVVLADDASEASQAETEVRVTSPQPIPHGDTGL